MAATPYATAQDIIARHGEDVLVLLADRDGDGAGDEGVVELALTDASSEIDTYLAPKYDLPLETVPPVLTRICVDIAVYRLASEADTGTEERRLRYEDAVALLKRLATRTVALDLAGDDGEALPRPRRVRVDAPSRVFGGEDGSLQSY